MYHHYNYTCVDPKHQVGGNTGGNTGCGPRHTSHRTRQGGDLPKSNCDGCYAIKREGGKVLEIIDLSTLHKDEDQSLGNYEILSMSDDHEDELQKILLSPADSTRYRGTTARLNYMASDRIDVQYATKEAARHMAAPEECHKSGLTRIGRYLVGKPRLIMHFRWQQIPTLSQHTPTLTGQAARQPQRVRVAGSYASVAMLSRATPDSRELLR